MARKKSDPVGESVVGALATETPLVLDVTKVVPEAVSVSPARVRPPMPDFLGEGAHECDRFFTPEGEDAKCFGWAKKGNEFCANCFSAQKATALGTNGRIPMPATGGPWLPCPTCTTGWRSETFPNCKRCYDRAQDGEGQNHRTNGKPPIPAEKVVEATKARILKFAKWLDGENKVHTEALMQANELLAKAEEEAAYADPDSQDFARELANGASDIVGAMIVEALAARWEKLWAESFRLNVEIPADARECLHRYGEFLNEEKYGQAAATLLRGTGILNIELKPARLVSRENGDGQGNHSQGQSWQDDLGFAPEKKRQNRVSKMERLSAIRELRDRARANA